MTGSKEAILIGQGKKTQPYWKYERLVNDLNQALFIYVLSRPALQQLRPL